MLDNGMYLSEQFIETTTTRQAVTEVPVVSMKGVDDDHYVLEQLRNGNEDAFMVLEEIGVPREADFYLCGPSAFLQDLTTGLADWGITTDRVHTEIFGPGASSTPGVVDAPSRPPHLPARSTGTGPQVSFARSGLIVHWDSAYQSLLELAEACDVPVRWSCRTGVCHTCESGLVAGTVSYQPEPLERPADGTLLICCSQPRDEVILDL